MQELAKDEMLRINGGGISAWGLFGIGALITLLAGVLDGFVRPPSCN